ncbi:hypothetical protein F4212_06375 [Candidatus Poribacteria bacterium]|nr:hypothetical protein [Candidatus Poribacteria bacterium]
MNDPHVVALIYRIEHGKLIDYSKAEPLVLEEPKFLLEVNDKQVRFDFKTHYATEVDARRSIEDYIRFWEFDTELKYGPDTFRLKFVKSEIVDRDPTPGMIYAEPLRVEVGIGPPALSISIGVGRYHPPPSDIGIDPDVEMIFQRYLRFRSGREPLLSFSYFCLTFLEYAAKRDGHSGRKREAAAEKYRIEKNVLDEIARLASQKGGPEARKAVGTAADRYLSQNERQFLNREIQRIVRRMAEIAHSDSQNEIT